MVETGGKGCDGAMDDADAAATWEEIDVAETYLICSMYQQAASTASSNLNPCSQIEQGSDLDHVQQYLEDFLNGWNPVDPQYATLIAEPNVDCETRYGRHFVLEIDQYLQLVELYVVTLLATVLKHVDLAISWVENNASLPEENRQALLRRLHSMHSLKSTTLNSPTDNIKAYSLKELNACEGSTKALSGKHANNKKYASKEAVLKLSERIEPYLCYFRSIIFRLQ
ncbi:hypothetical protein TanjilG_18705 [Lupinus angustifolius]|uniref:Uncharacterized protein n=1 Tax=Lupinus angustifolius TaxID=3871 RepID=A0A1J7FVM9_LUPAN|nr:hypothetical protein TanjilG_18705 [Lupinus angustifolius]